MRQTVIATKQDRQWQGIPAIERAANGRLWAAFFSGGPKEPDPTNFVLLSTSEDDGVTWSEPMNTVDLPGDTRVYDPSLWHDPNGRLWLFYNHACLDPKDFSIWAMTTDNSDSATPTWSAPRKIEVGVPFAFRLNKPTVLTNGDWLLPVTWADAAPDDWFAMTGQLQGVAISSDQGGTWSFHGAVDAPRWALENMFLERADGRVWMLIRTGAGVLWESFSADGGRTWTEAQPTTIVNPGVRFFIGRLASGRILLINTPDPKRRQTMLAYVADDEEGIASATSGLLLDGRNSVSYPDAVQGPDGTIYAVHDYDRAGHGEIVLSVFEEADIPTVTPL